VDENVAVARAARRVDRDGVSLGDRTVFDSCVHGFHGVDIVVAEGVSEIFLCVTGRAPQGHLRCRALLNEETRNGVFVIEGVRSGVLVRRCDHFVFPSVEKVVDIRLDGMFLVLENGFVVVAFSFDDRVRVVTSCVGVEQDRDFAVGVVSVVNTVSDGDVRLVVVVLGVADDDVAVLRVVEFDGNLCDVTLCDLGRTVGEARVTVAGFDNFEVATLGGDAGVVVRDFDGVRVCIADCAEVNLKLTFGVDGPFDRIVLVAVGVDQFGRDITVDRVGGDRRGHVLVGLEFLFVDFDVEAEFAHVERGLGVIVVVCDVVLIANEVLGVEHVDLATCASTARAANTLSFDVEGVASVTFENHVLATEGLVRGTVLASINSCRAEGHVVRVLNNSVSSRILNTGDGNILNVVVDRTRRIDENLTVSGTGGCGTGGCGTTEVRFSTVSEADSNVGSVDGACVNSIIERQFDSGANGGVVTHVVSCLPELAGSVVNSEGRRLTCVRVQISSIVQGGILVCIDGVITFVKPISGQTTPGQGSTSSSLRDVGLTVIVGAISIFVENNIDVPCTIRIVFYSTTRVIAGLNRAVHSKICGSGRSRCSGKTDCNHGDDHDRRKEDRVGLRAIVCFVCHCMLFRSASRHPCFALSLLARSSSTYIASRARPDLDRITRNRRRIVPGRAAPVPTVVGYKCFVWLSTVCERPARPGASVRRPFSKIGCDSHTLS